MIEIKDVQVKKCKPAIDQLMQGLQESEKSLFEKSANWQEIRKDYLKHMIAMQETYEGTCLVTYDSNEPVAFIFGYLEEPDESRIEEYTGKELYVSEGYVKPSHRQQGLYKKMNELLEQKYIQLGIKRITRFTLVNNEPMKSFLTTAGYRVTRLLFEKWL